MDDVLVYRLLQVINGTRTLDLSRCFPLLPDTSLVCRLPLCTIPFTPSIPVVVQASFSSGELHCTSIWETWGEEAWRRSETCRTSTPRRERRVVRSAAWQQRIGSIMDAKGLPYP